MRVRTIYKVKVLSHLMKRRSEQGAVTSGDLHRIRGARPGMSGVECGRLRAESCQIRGILCGIVKKVRLPTESRVVLGNSTPQAIGGRHGQAPKRLSRTIATTYHDYFHWRMSSLHCIVI